MTDPKAERVYEPRELRAVDAVAMGLIGGGTVCAIVFLVTGTPGRPLSARLLLSIAMILCGVALKLRVLQEHKRKHTDAVEKTFE